MIYYSKFDGTFGLIFSFEDEIVFTLAIHWLCLPVSCLKFEKKLVMPDFVDFKAAAINIT